MIARLTGTLLERTPQSIIIDVGGVGYDILASLGTYQSLPPVGESTSLHIHTHVREDDIVLFGFSELREKKLFQLLIKVNGVGPRLAINILSGISTDQLIQALRSEDLIRITAIPGIGKKTGERLILDLKDKLIDLQVAGADPSTGPGLRSANPFRDDLISVLSNLGYKRNAAEKALRDIHFDENISLQDAVRQTLKELGNGGGAANKGAHS